MNWSIVLSMFPKINTLFCMYLADALFIQYVAHNADDVNNEAAKASKRIREHPTSAK